jgi:hypothetical protein
VTDPGGLWDAASTIVTVYDPDAGFVTGGGWIDSEAGWGQLDQVCSVAEGKANFGFVSKYQKGQAPSGNTQFGFSAGRLNFHSTLYESLVITENGTAGQYSGTGLVNGEVCPTGEPYRFTVWATDGSAEQDDTSRIRIWCVDGGDEIVVYDPGSGQALDGGSIVIHAGK